MEYLTWVVGTPIFAAIINRIVDERLAIGKGPLGFLNPVLYDNEWALNDIVNGSNPGCGTEGFTAAVGYVMSVLTRLDPANT